VLSGPNTGGKTVAIKTFGLAVLMAQSGIPVPAAEARLPLYRQLRCDIGDHQSIEADLSTYSARIRTVVGCLRDAAPPALFLFDEIGSGTEPVEGAALAQSILEALQRPGMTTVATTHQGALKAWAFTTEGAVSAAMEFDAESLRPTFSILMGAAGVSAGLDIAERLGLDPAVVAGARRRMGEGNVQSESYLARLRDLTADLARRQEEAARLEADLTEERRRLQSRAEQEQRKRRQTAERALDRALDEFRTLWKSELAAIRDKAERRRAERELGKLEHRLRMERERRADEIAPVSGPAEADGWELPDTLREGMQVYVRSLAREGTLKSTRGDRVDVTLGRVVFTVERSDLRVRSGRAAAGETPTSKVVEAPRRARGPELVFREAPRELRLLGMTVDDALSELDRFLDAAALSGYPEVRVIHGHGTGRLRRAVREFLRSHVHVASHRPGKPQEGGDGATIVRLNL
jgi:DNA mismatch repair protein MutS2